MNRDCLAYLVDMRFGCRRAVQWIDAASDARHQVERQARLLRETKNPMLIRRAETMEAEIAQSRDAWQPARDYLLRCGRDLMRYSAQINAEIPQAVMLDLLNVNRADRARVSPDDGIIEIAYIDALEDSAMYRGSDWKQGPLAQAVTRYISNELATNDQLQQRAQEHLFGKGGMFEFLPMYRTTGNGTMVRMPPKLRLADECDVKEVAA